MSESVPEVPKFVRLTEWKKEPTVAELKQDLEDAKPHHSAQVQRIDDWRDNFNMEGKAKINTPKGSSSVAPKLIRKQAEWRYPALSEPYLSTENLFKISPVGLADREAALQNSLILNNQFNTRIDRVSFIDEYVRTAVDEGTVIVRTGWEYEDEEYEVDVPDYQYFPSDDPALMQAYQQLDQLQHSNPDQYSQVPPELLEGHATSKRMGMPLQAVVSGTRKEKRTRVLVNHPTVEVCDYRNVVIDPTCKGNLDKAGFVIYSFESSLSELRKGGRYQNLEAINLENNSPLSEPDHASDDGTKVFNFADKARKKFIVHEYWGYRDIDGSGRVQPIVAAWVGDVLIRLELNPFPDKKVPFVLIPYLPVRRESYGEPDGALLEDNQKIIGAVTRGMIDIMGKAANGQTGMRKDMLDTVNRRRWERGQDYEFNANVDPNQGVFMHTFPEIPASAQYMLQMQNQEAESLTGVKAFANTGLSSGGLGDVATGIRGVLDAASKRELGILRRLSKGIIAIGRKIIAMNAEWLSEEEVVRITEDEFVVVRRDDLPGNFDLKVTISTAEEDNQKAQELAFMLQTMGNNMDAEMNKMILSDIARLRKMPDLAKKIEEFQPQPDPVAQKLQQLEVAKLEAELQAIQVESALNQARIDTERAKATKLRAEADKADLDFIEQESGVQQERDLQKQGAQAHAQAQMKVLDHQLKKDLDKDKAS